MKIIGKGMTIEEAIDILEEVKVLDDSIYQYDTAYLEALDIAVKSLEAWAEIKQEINDLFSKPACYMPNYDAYKMFLDIIDKHLQEVDNDLCRKEAD